VEIIDQGNLAYGCSEEPLNAFFNNDDIVPKK
jgi:hypothetical protein